MNIPLLEVDQLCLSIHGLKILHGISFTIYPGEIVALVGQSGCGKSLTASAILGLFPPSHKYTGQVIFEGKNVLNRSQKELSYLGTRLGLILQDPGLALNPLLSIGHQLTEGLCCHKKMPYEVAWEKGIEWLQRVGIGDPHIRMRQYPHEMSGGMKQRILIAMALICGPSLLIADEPTTALDLTVQAQILQLLQTLQKEEEMSILLITHDLGVVAHCCHRVMVMQAGQLIEMNSVEQLFINPQYHYTKELLDARRCLEKYID